MKKETFRLDKAFFEPLSLLSDQQLGQLLRAIYHYQLGLPVPEMDTPAKIAYLFITEQFNQKTARRQKSADITADRYSENHTGSNDTEIPEVSLSGETHLPEVSDIDAVDDTTVETLPDEPIKPEISHPETSASDVKTRCRRHSIMRPCPGQSRLRVSVRPDGRIKIRRHFARSIIKNRKYRYR